MKYTVTAAHAAGIIGALSLIVPLPVAILMADCTANRRVVRIEALVQCLSISLFPAFPL